MSLSKPFFAKTFLYFMVTSLIAASKIQTNEPHNEYETLPNCNEQKIKDTRFIFVSTLDGKFSALNVENGDDIWSIETGPGPMLSSSIHRLELTNKGHWARMIPSLSGHIYKFNGESLEAVPVNAEQLLKNSFRYSDDLITSGGRETRTYGVDVDSGRVIYECSMHGCDNLTTDLSSGHVLLVKRDSQTIRAIEQRTGAERWNYSVAQMEIKLAEQPGAECHDYNKLRQDDVQIKVIVPEGLVCALSKRDPHRILWKHKFDTPVVHAWQYDEGTIQEVNLFSGSGVPSWAEEYLSTPSLYIGMHQKQLYIQESVVVQRGVEEQARPQLTSDTQPRKPLRIPWKPYPASSNAIGLLESNDIPQITNGESGSSDKTTALSVLYASEYVNGNGFYLYSHEDGDSCCDNDTVVEESSQQSNPDELPDLEEQTVPIQMIVSLSYWWKEVMIISVTTAILFNLFFTQRFLYLVQRQEIHQPIVVVQAPAQRGSDSGLDTGQGMLCNGTPGNTPDFTSRYLDDFEQVRCLGKGGFGVVFEARKKIDDCSYAVKRIQLPFRTESKERVMREVKALAKLEHPHIVRYYHSWLECPPPGWQEQQDKSWQRELQSRDSLLCNGDTISGDDSSDTPKKRHATSSHRPLLPFHNGDITVNIPSDDSRAHSEFSDSIIQFKEPSKEPTYGRVPSICSTSCEEENISASSDEESSPAKLLPCPIFLYIQMQLCQKESLSEWLQNRSRVLTKESLHVFCQITQAVEYVHMQELIHRDLKPSNIFFSIDGLVKVGDFGLVTDSSGSGVDVETGQRTPCEDLSWAGDATGPVTQRKHTANVGTRLYMSPEQMIGMQYDHTVDIYSLGIILFELLSTFSTQMERADTLQALRNRVFPPEFPSTFKVEYVLLLKMLSHIPQERPSAQEIRNTLPHALQVNH